MSSMKQELRGIKVGIGFVTGRKSFQKVLRTYIYKLDESDFIKSANVDLNLFVAYDLTYNKTKVSDYTKILPDIKAHFKKRIFIDEEFIKADIDELIDEGVLSSKQAQLILGKGYAAKRNAVLYTALKNKMDYLIFLDDDEYPMAVTKTLTNAVWGGQNVLSTHLKHLPEADITHGPHCGYVSPIPYMEFNEILTEVDFKTFIEAISNDILSWHKIKEVMQRGGVTYADTKILTSNEATEVEETKHHKFISGANLGINLTNPKRVFPFYNPPRARGEDTFLSTCLSDRKVLRVPCYTFHDGFSTYSKLLEGFLPMRLEFITGDNEKVVKRFYKACIGWIRYKPLLLYITEPHSYEKKINEIREKLTITLPKLASYFQQPDFNNILKELEKYHKNVQKHYHAYQETQEVWAKMMEHLAQHIED